MPPKGKLPDREVALLTRWVDDGRRRPAGRRGRPARAEDDRRREGPDVLGVPAAEEPAAPAVARRGWPRIAARPLHPGRRWRRRACGPPPPADRRTLIRRATFDLTGLPPTPEEVEAFLGRRRRRDAFAQVVDRLLASPALRRALGPALARRRPLRRLQRPRRERRPRQRLAVPRLRHRRVQRRQAVRPVPARADRRRPAARRPTPPTRHERLIATGFLALGPEGAGRGRTRRRWRWTSSTSRSTRVGRAFLGLTLGCARCHDHKFDPIPTRRLLRPGRHLQEHADDGALQEDRPLAREPARPPSETWPARPRTTAGRRAEGRDPTLIAKANDEFKADAAGDDAAEGPEPLYPPRRRPS